MFLILVIIIFQKLKHKLERTLHSMSGTYEARRVPCAYARLSVMLPGSYILLLFVEVAKLYDLLCCVRAVLHSVIPFSYVTFHNPNP